MQNLKFSWRRNPLTALLFNILLVYILFSLSRLVFLVCNWQLYAGSLSFGHALSLFAAGLLFDTSAIIYTNALIIIAFLLPLHLKENRIYYRVVRWIYVIFNTIALCANLADCVYFPYTGKRTTTTVFAEFSHEGAGSMTKILGEQLISNWYLVILLIVLAWVLWRCFLPRYAKDERAEIHLPKYYGFQILSLGILLPLCLGGVRGGFTTTTRPITISNANQYVDRPTESGIVLNTPFSIYRTLSKKPMVVPNYMSNEEAEALFSPVHQPNDSVAFQPKNVVVLIMESFGKQNFGFYNKTRNDGTYAGFTPFLDSLITHGAMTWQYSYANGRKSIEGMPSVLSSLPNYVEPLFLTPASLNHLSGLARELGTNKGYQTGFFHGAPNGSMGFQAFAKSTGFAKYYGMSEYEEDSRFNGAADFDGTWAIWDEEFLQFYALQMSEMQQPFMTSVFTASSHPPFAMPERYKGKFPKGPKPLMECVAYSDNALRNFFNTARQQPWFQNTIFVITSDHTSSAYYPFYTTTLGYSCVPIILYAPADSTLHGFDTQLIVEQIDIMPTILSYLHYDRPYVAFGKDMLHTAAEDGRALHWVPDANGYEFVKGEYAYEFDGKQLTAAYAYRTDSLLEHNVLSEVPSETAEKAEREMKSIIQQYLQRMNNDNLVIDKD